VVATLRDHPLGATTVELAELLVERGDPRVDPKKRDHTNTIRTALMTARRNGEVDKGEDGKWRVSVGEGPAVMEAPDYSYSGSSPE
jgi:hypothetical protein